MSTSGSKLIETDDFQMLREEVGDSTAVESLDSGAEKADSIDLSKYVADRAPDSSIHYNLRTISYSGLLSLHSCPRRFELTRLLPKVGNQDVDEDAAGHLDFGTVVGNGVQELLVSGSIERAHFRAFLDWKDNLESERGEKSAKTFWHALQAISKFTELLYGPLSQYEMVYFQGKPAIELGFSIDCGNGFRYRGKLDALLIHKTKREFLPIECKTTGSFVVDESMYGNSSQAIGYGVVIDAVAAEMEVEYNSYDVAYPVYKTRKMEWDFFRFHKSNTTRALWLQSTLLDIHSIQQFADLDYFPTRGESCFSYGRQCRYYGSCGLSNRYLIGEKEDIPVRLDKKGEYPLEFSIEQLVRAQVEKEVESSESGNEEQTDETFNTSKA